MCKVPRILNWLYKLATSISCTLYIYIYIISTIYSVFSIRTLYHAIYYTPGSINIQLGVQLYIAMQISIRCPSKILQCICIVKYVVNYAQNLYELRNLHVHKEWWHLIYKNLIDLYKKIETHSLDLINILIKGIVCRRVQSLNTQRSIEATSRDYQYNCLHILRIPRDFPPPNLTPSPKSIRGILSQIFNRTTSPNPHKSSTEFGDNNNGSIRHKIAKTINRV